MIIRLPNDYLSLWEFQAGEADYFELRLENIATNTNFI